MNYQVCACIMWIMMNLLSYIDPATTAIIWQVLVGVFVAFSLVLAIWWKKISVFFRGLFVKKKRDERREENHVIELGSLYDKEGVEKQIEELNEQGIREITIVMQELDPALEYLVDKYGVEFKLVQEGENENI